MDIRQLTYFVRTVELGSITTAAQQLRVAQPALGFSIRKLEEELEVQLLIRHSRGIEPTEAGQELYRRAVDILTRTEEARQALKDFAGEPRGKVVIGMTPTTSQTLSAKLITKAAELYPQVAISIIEDMSGVLMEWVDEERLDLCLAYEVPPTRTRNSEPLACEDLFMVSAPDGGSGGEISLKEAVSQRLLMPGSPHGLRDLVEDAARKQGLALAVAYEIQSMPTLRELAAQGIAPAILPFGSFAREAEQGRMRIRRIVDPPITRTLHLSYSARRSLSKAARALRDLLRKLVAEESGESTSTWRQIEKKRDRT